MKKNRKGVGLQVRVRPDSVAKYEAVVLRALKSELQAAPDQYKVESKLRESHTLQAVFDALSQNQSLEGFAEFKAWLTLTRPEHGRRLGGFNIPFVTFWICLKVTIGASTVLDGWFEF